MKKDGERIYLTKDEAISALNEGENIHTFLNPSGGMLMGCDMSRESIIKLFEEHNGFIEIGGEAAQGMKHALVVFDNGEPLFIESNMEKIREFDPLPA